MTEDVRVGDLGLAPIQGGDGRHLVLGQLEVEDVEVLRDPAGVRPTSGSATRPSWTCQRSTTWVADLPYRSAIPRSPDRCADRRPEPPIGLQDSVTIPCSPSKARLSSRVLYGLSWIWLTSGSMPVSSITRCRWAGLKFEVPMARSDPVVQQRRQPAERVDDSDPGQGWASAPAAGRCSRRRAVSGWPRTRAYAVDAVPLPVELRGDEDLARGRCRSPGCPGRRRPRCGSSRRVSISR